MLMADLDPKEAAGLAAWSAGRFPWPEQLGDETAKPYFEGLLRFVADERRRSKSEIYPSHADMFKAFHLTSFEDVRVVILGQDPYPNPGEAMGLAFSVPPSVPKPTSLLSIDKALVQDGFRPLPNGDLTGWATQGVFLLNAALTVPRGGKPSHLSRWRPFTDEVIRRVSQRPGPPVVFVLWGAEAQRKRRLIDGRHPVVTAPHPAARGAHRRRFHEAHTFSRVNEMLVELVEKPITWSLT
jgi:uracil-DNA glycosylase